jgi:hypothetical protein
MKNTAVTLLLGAALAIALFAFHALQRRPKVAVLPATTSFPTNQIPWTERLIPKRWAWASALRHFLEGPPKSYRMGFRAFGFPNSPEALAAQLNLGTPVAVTNGFAVWLLPSDARLAAEICANTSAGTSFIDDPSVGVAHGGMGASWTLTYAESMRGDNLHLQLIVHQYQITSPAGESFTHIRALLTRGSALLLTPTNPAPILTKTGWMPHCGLFVWGIVTDSTGNSVIY